VPPCRSAWNGRGRRAFLQRRAELAGDHERVGELTEHILGGLKEAMPVDIVFLCLHGAQMSEGIDDCEGAVLAATRAIVGPNVAIGVLLDLHANVTSEMCSNADLTVSCREYPHVDYAERAERCCQC
jgi:microcystin degradation protein MlrC